jgi:hypothetical protein
MAQGKPTSVAKRKNTPAGSQDSATRKQKTSVMRRKRMRTKRGTKRRMKVRKRTKMKRAKTGK